ncbi:MAG: hypothetical protein P4L31_06545 [Candidatus Babeliales bacterium]|nr:hypothetical protein [Candidatus Babeliales bacterium]
MILKKILIGCLAISSLINHLNTYCAAPAAEHSRAQTPSQIDPELAQIYPASMTITPTASPSPSLEEFRQSPIRDLAQNVQKLDRDAIDLLWAENLRPYTTKPQAQQFGGNTDFQENYPQSHRTIPVNIHYLEKDYLNKSGSGYQTSFSDPKVAELEFPSSQHKPIFLQGHKNSIITDSQHPTKDIVATGDKDGTIIIWNTKTGQQLAHFSQPGTQAIDPILDWGEPLFTLQAIYFSKDGSMLITESRFTVDQASLLTYWASPFGILSYEQVVLLSLIVDQFNETKHVDFLQLAQKYKKPINVLQNVFATFHPEAQKILKKKYKIKNESAGSTACIIS